MNTDFTRLQREADRNKRFNELAKEAYKEYQKNIKLSETLQCEILKGVKSGENILPLFLKAVKAISLMTSNKLFYTEIAERLNKGSGKP